MAGTVITDLVFFTGATGGSTSNCDAITDWITAPTLDNITYVEGTGSCSAKVSKTTFTSVFSFVSAVNLTNKVLYIWAMCSGKLDTLANGGLRIRVVDGSANWGEWYVAGTNTWAGGWQPFLAHTSTTFSAQSATPPTISAITKAGIVFTTTGSATAVNCWWDAFRYGTYLGVKGGTDVSPATLQDMIDAEATSKYGVIFQYEGLSIVQGKLVFGSTTGGDATYFSDTTEKVLIFADKPVPATWYDITLQGNATANTKVYFGIKVGTSGVSGITVRASNSAKPFTITASDTNVTEYGFYGCTFYQASTITLQAYSAVKEMLGCTISKSAEMLPNTGIVKNCSILSAVGRGLRITYYPNLNVTDCKFINNPQGVHVNFSDSVTFSGLVFSGSDGSTKWDVEHSIAGLVTIDNTGGSNVTAAYVQETGGGSHIVNTPSTLTVTVKNEAGSNVQGAQVYIQKPTPGALTSDAGNNAGDGDFIVNETVDTDIPQTGTIIIWNKVNNKITPYRYASWTVKTFTLRTQVTGSCTSTGSSTQLLDTGANFGGTTDLLEGDTIRNTTDGSWAVVDEIVSTTELLTSPLQIGRAHV